MSKSTVPTLGGFAFGLAFPGFALFACTAIWSLANDSPMAHGLRLGLLFLLGAFITTLIAGSWRTIFNAEIRRRPVDHAEMFAVPAAATAALAGVASMVFATTGLILALGGAKTFRTTTLPDLGGAVAGLTLAITSAATFWILNVRNGIDARRHPKQAAPSFSSDPVDADGPS